MRIDRPILNKWPALRARLPFVPLGDFPTPIEPLDAVMAHAGAGGVSAFVKRDDRSSPTYGGNKVRTLEVLFGQALAAGATRIVSTGAFGSNHATAAALHAPRVGLRTGALLFSQPRSACARENLEVLLTHTEDLYAIPHWSTFLPALAVMKLAYRLKGERVDVMVPGGATPLGALAYVSAALELVGQVAAGDAPPPRTVVVGVGSTCTTAGLLLGLTLAPHLDVGWPRRVPSPRLVASRITPWPVTAALRIAHLAARTSRLLAELTGDRGLVRTRRQLLRNLEVDSGQLGAGYGEPTEAGREAISLFDHHPMALDTTYSAKSAASLLSIARTSPHRAPLLFWSTKSTAPLPTPDPAAVARSPWLTRRWMAAFGH